MKIWVLTSEHNEYDQYGEYFIKAFKNKPSHEQIVECTIGTEHFIDGWSTGLSEEEYIKHILNGGGRVKAEHIWFYLNEVVV